MGTVGMRIVEHADFEVDPSRTVVFDRDPPGEITFVANVVFMDATLPFKFDEDCVLDRPSEIELAKLRKRLIEASTAGSGSRNLCWHYENEGIELRMPSGKTAYSTAALKESEWRYYIVRTTDYGVKSLRLHKLANITSTPLDLNSLILYSDTHLACREQGIKRHHTFAPQERRFTTISDGELRVLKALYLKWGDGDRAGRWKTGVP